MKKIPILFIFLLSACIQTTHLKFQTISDLTAVPDTEKTYIFHHDGYIRDVRFEKVLEKILAKHGWQTASNAKNARYVVYFSFSGPIIVVNSYLRTFGVAENFVQKIHDKEDGVFSNSDTFVYSFFMSVRENKKMTGERFGKEVFSAVLRNNYTDLNRQTVENFIEKILTRYFAHPDTTKYYTCEESYAKNDMTSFLFEDRIRRSLVKCSENGNASSETVQTLDFEINE